MSARWVGCLLMTLLTGVSADQWLDIPRGKGEQCVEPTEIMRKQHMEFLFHDRDLTMRKGDRTIRHSLIDCIACHTQATAQGEAIPINSTGQFCAICHEAVGVAIDCFQCHATVPASASRFDAMGASLPESVHALMRQLAIVQ